jgi:hypothetical protein
MTMSIKDFTADDISLSDCTSYHTARVNAAWTDATADEKEAALIRGFDYIRVQPFRTDLDLFNDGLPTDIEQAVYEAALIEVTSPGMLLKNETRDDQMSEIRMGPLVTKYQVDAGTQFTKITALLAPYVAQGITLTR